jgi:hypothetical protein
MHETFPKLLGKISKTTWKNFQNYLEKFPKLLGNIEEVEISK